MVTKQYQPIDPATKRSLITCGYFEIDLNLGHHHAHRFLLYIHIKYDKHGNALSLVHSWSNKDAIPKTFDQQTHTHTHSTHTSPINRALRTNKSNKCNFSCHRTTSFSLRLFYLSFPSPGAVILGLHRVLAALCVFLCVCVLFWKRSTTPTRAAITVTVERVLSAISAVTRAAARDVTSVSSAPRIGNWRTASAIPSARKVSSNQRSDVRNVIISARRVRVSKNRIVYSI